MADSTPSDTGIAGESGIADVVRRTKVLSKRRSQSGTRLPSARIAWTPCGLAFRGDFGGLKSGGKNAHLFNDDIKIKK